MSICIIFNFSDINGHVMCNEDIYRINIQLRATETFSTPELIVLPVQINSNYPLGCFSFMVMLYCADSSFIFTSDMAASISRINQKNVFVDHNILPHHSNISS